MCKNNLFIENVQADLVGVGVGYFDTGMCCRYDRYDLYFNDENKEVRRSALTAFTMMLGTWHSGSSFSFTPQHLRKFDGAFDEVQFHELQHYIKAFVTHHLALRNDFPVLYAFIVWFFIHIEDTLLSSFEEEFPEIDPAWCVRLREEVLQPNKSIETPAMKDFFIETKIEPFFLSDLPEGEV